MKRLIILFALLVVAALLIACAAPTPVTVVQTKVV